MCTAITFGKDDFYFGRTLDYERSFGEEVVITPRAFPLPFREQKTMKHHHAIIGMAHVEDGYPLYYDGVNEMGLCMAGLNFVGFAKYNGNGRDRIAPFEFLPWVLGQCDSVARARERLGHLALTETDFSPELPAARLHWIIADRHDCITVESLESGLRIHDNPAGVLTNDPPFDDQMFQLTNFMHLSPRPPHNHFSDTLELKPYSRGMGAMGLPGDLSSQSRFVRATFHKLNSVCTDTNAVSQFFHILGSVNQTRGCCRLEDGSFEHTLYTSCCNASRGIYHYTTYGCRRITAVNMGRENLDGNGLIRYPLVTGEDILLQN
ncbi:MAG: choloylglycine hydrolase family protein [Ruminococcaceae bacterium]|nr:choloylglycine hydrolase family protein [Oscillospiraceae bacterium]